MEICSVYDYVDPHLRNVLLLKNETLTCTSSSEVLDPLWSQGSSVSLLNFERDIKEEVNTQTSASFKRANYNDAKRIEICEEFFDHGFDHQPCEKKRRLNPDQVRSLEKIFEVENRLEPDRKDRLAKELGLHPRQVAIWFQNRRARCKTKVLERDYDALKAKYDRLKEDFDALSEENEKLKNQINSLLEKLPVKENEQLRKDQCDTMLQSDAKQTKTSSPKHIFDYSDSPHRTNRHENHSAIILTDPAGYSSPHTFEAAESSDFSQDEDDFSLSKGFLQASSCFPKLEEVVVESYDDHLQPNSCNFGFPVQNQGTWLWQI